MAYSSPMVFILTVDQHIFFWVLGIAFFFVLSMVALFSKGRRWYELVAMFLVFYVVALLVASLIFTHIVNLPFAQLETVSVP